MPRENKRGGGCCQVCWLDTVLIIVALVLIIPFDFFGYKLLYYGAMLMERAGIYAGYNPPVPVAAVSCRFHNVAV